MMHSQMEDPKEYGLIVMSDSVEKVTEMTSHTKTNEFQFYLVKSCPSPEGVKKEEAHKLYQQMSVSMYHILQEIDLRKVSVD